jgi:hypothetical protein
VSAPPEIRPRDNSVFGGCLEAIAKVGCIAAVLIAVGIAFVAWQISSSLNSGYPKPVQAPVSWTSFDVVLSADHPVAHGTISYKLHGGSSSVAGLGVNLGVPQVDRSASASQDVSAVLNGPLVRVTAKSATGPAGECLGACELYLNSNCTSDCTVAFDVTVTLETLPPSGSVTVRVTGGASATIGKQVPDVQFVLEGGSPVDVTPIPSPRGS